MIHTKKEVVDYVRYFRTYPLIKNNSPTLCFHCNLPLAKANLNPNLAVPSCPSPWPASSLFLDEAGSQRRDFLKHQLHSIKTVTPGRLSGQISEGMAVQALCQRF